MSTGKTVEAPIETDKRKDPPVAQHLMRADQNRDTIKGEVSKDLRHDSAAKHVTGSAEYCDDIPEPVGTLHAYLGLSTRAHALIRELDLSAVRSAPGVIGVLTAEDLPGSNDVSPTGRNDEPIFATEKVEFWGQPMFAVVD